MSKIYSKKDGTVEKSKLDPRLKMIANGNYDVNRIRAEFKGNVALETNIDEDVCQKGNDHYDKKN